jgi:hypothetical protein
MKTHQERSKAWGVNGADQTAAMEDIDPYVHNFTVMARLVCQNTCPFAAYIRDFRRDSRIRTVARSYPTVNEHYHQVVHSLSLAYCIVNGYHGPND